MGMFLPNSMQPRLLEQVENWHENDVPLYAPTLWRYQVTSTLAKLAHIREITEETSAKVLDIACVSDFSIIAPDESLSRPALRWTFRLRRASAYDCFYVALAELLQGELWTADRKLFRAVGQDRIRYAST